MEEEDAPTESLTSKLRKKLPSLEKLDEIEANLERDEGEGVAEAGEGGEGVEEEEELLPWDEEYREFDWVKFGQTHGWDVDYGITYSIRLFLLPLSSLLLP